MTPSQLEAVVRTAIGEHVLPATATVPRADDTARPWPVALLTALGAWLAAVPLLAVIGLLLGDFVTRNVGTYVVGALLLAGAVVVLRSRGLPLFVEQLAVPALLVGGGALGFGLFRDVSDAIACVVLGVLALALAVAMRESWLRALLGVVAAGLFAAALASQRGPGEWGVSMPRWWWAWHVVLAPWLAVVLALRRALRGAVRESVEAIASGWLLAVLAGLAWWSGMTFLAGASVGFGGFDASLHAGALPQALSAMAVAAGAAWAAGRWPGLRTPWLAGVALVLMALAWFMPSLGALLLALSVCVTTHRWRLAGAAVVAAAWIVGAFYYQLAWPLGQKAIVLAAAGALLGALAWWGAKATGDRVALPGAAGAPPPVSGVASPVVASTASPAVAVAAAMALPAAARLPRWGIAACVVAVLGVANVGIRQKETLIRDGQPVFVELAPVDPRSLMQGDFMRLNFRLPQDVQGRLDSLVAAARPHVVARRDARGIATLLRIDDGSPLAEGELRIELTPKGGRWVLVSDAWFFAEGQADRWQRAKYGEFRVEPGGRALLVGLRGPDLAAL